MAEGRSEPQLAPDSKRGLWQSQIDKVKDAEEKLGNRVSVTQIRSEETSEENSDQEKIENILKRIKERTKLISEEPAVYQYRGEEKLEQNEIKDILTEKVGTKSGLKEIIKQLIKNKLETLNVEISEEESPLELLLGSSERRETFIKPTDRPASFLDRLSAIYNPTTEAPEQFIYSDDYEENPEEDKEKGLESLFSSYEYEDFNSYIEADRSSPVENIYDLGTVENEIDILSSEEEEFYTTEEDIAKNFLAEEIESAQTETQTLVNEMEKMLVMLEGKIILFI